MKIMRLMLLLAGVLVLTACQDKPEKPWIPVLEQVDFVALKDAVAEVQRHVDHAAQQLKSAPSDPVSRDLEQARQSLFKLERYFLPMTEVRQLSYAADRIYFSGRKEVAQEKLNQAKLRLIEVGTAGGMSVEEAVAEVIAMIETLERSIDSEPGLVAEKMRVLGEKVNLMILKGELILAGTKFSS